MHHSTDSVPRLTVASVALSLVGVAGIVAVCLMDNAYALALGFTGRRFVVVVPLACAVLGAIVGIVSRVRRPHQPSVARKAVVAQAVMSFGLSAMWFLYVVNAALEPAYAHGRRLLRRGRLATAPLARGRSWNGDDVTAISAVPGIADMPEAIRSAVAAAWRENARTEHASIAAFGEVALDLLAVGAPAELVANAHADALDEIRHTRLCFAVAHAIDGRDEAPAAFPDARSLRTLPTFSRTMALTHIAASALVDGAFNEGISARILARLAERATCETLRETLRSMAVDEARHAVHSWAVVDWCAAEGGAPVMLALTKLASTLSTNGSPSLPPLAEGGAWEGWGVQGRALETGEIEKAQRTVVQKLARLEHLTRAADAAA